MNSKYNERIELSRNKAQHISPRIVEILDDPELTTEKANKLLAAVNIQCLEVSRLASEMKAAGADDSMNEAAQQLETVWNGIALQTAVKVIELKKPRWLRS